MSREQWGHGYWTGRDAESKKPEEAHWCVQHRDDGSLYNILYIHRFYKDTIAAEWLDWADADCASAFGYTPAFSEENIVPEAYFEIPITELNKPRFYHGWPGVLQEYRAWAASLNEKEKTDDTV